MVFSISDQCISTEALKNALRNPEAGALATFEGWVRNHNEGQAVESLEYEVYEELSLSEGHRILQEASEKFDLLDARAEHRKGHLQIGDLAVFVAVVAKHRASAFAACRYIIDEIKARLPIWKKEHYRDAPASWVNCQGCAHTHDLEKDFYSRQILLRDLGKEGQAKLKSSRVLVVGAGGLGCPVLTYLASAGVGDLTILDSDLLEVSNLHRQTLYSYADRGMSKAHLAARRLREMNPFITVEGLRRRLDANNASELINGYDLVLDCSDNFSTKFLLADACFLADVPLIQASVYQREGQLLSFFSKQSACHRCLWPEMPSQACVGSCEEVGVMGVLPGILGTLQASEGLRFLLGQLCQSAEHLILVDSTDLSLQSLKRNKNQACLLCGHGATLQKIEAEIYVSKEDFELSWVESQDRTLEYIDIRSPEECLDQPAQLPGLKMSLSHCPGGNFEIQKDSHYLLICRSGQRSFHFVQNLRQQGYRNVFSLQGGLEGLQQGAG